MSRRAAGSRMRIGVAVAVMAIAACTSGETAPNQSTGAGDGGAAPTTTQRAEPGSGPTTTSAPPWTATLFWPRAERTPSCTDLSPIVRDMAPTDDPATALVAALLDGPSATEADAGAVALVTSTPRFSVRSIAAGIEVEFFDLLEVAPELTGACEGGRLLRALESSLGRFAETVLLTADGEPLESVIGRRCVVPAVEPAAEDVLVYFRCDAMPAEAPFPVYRPAKQGTTAERLTLAVDALYAGPTDAEWSGGFVGPHSGADGLVLRSVTVSDGRAVVDFTRGQGDIGRYEAGGVSHLDELLATTFQFPDVTTAEFTLDGSCDAFAAQFEAGCLVFDRRDATEALWSGVERAAASVMAADLTFLDTTGPRPAGSGAESTVGDWIVGGLLDLTAAVETEAVPLPSGLTSRNIWTTFGSGPQHVLMGAHYDSVTVSPGIDDNGSGTVVLLELARRLSADPPDGVTVTIVFFGAEEVLDGYPRTEHHFGSRLMADRMAEAGELPDLMVSADMIGVGGQLYAATYRDADPGAAELLATVAADIGVDVRVISRGDISDHEAFARAGVPSVFMWRPDNPAWHTAGDDRADIHLLLEDLEILEAFVGSAAAG